MIWLVYPVLSVTYGNIRRAGEDASSFRGPVVVMRKIPLSLYIARKPAAVIAPDVAVTRRKPVKAPVSVSNPGT